MKSSRVSYQVRTKEGAVVTEGSFEDVRRWLSEARIGADDQLKRSGQFVLEGDELWGRLKDFPEFKLTAREDRQLMARAIVRGRRLMFIGMLAFFVGAALIAWSQLIPRYVESSKVTEALEMADLASAAAKIAEAKALAAEKQAQALRRSVAELENEGVRLASELKHTGEAADGARKSSITALDQKNAVLLASENRVAVLNGRVSSLEAELKAEKQAKESALKMAAASAKASSEHQMRHGELALKVIRLEKELQDEKQKGVFERIFGSGDK